MTPVPFSKNDSRYNHEEYAPLVWLNYMYFP
jgi:hypothetical protein